MRHVLRHRQDASISWAGSLGAVHGLRPCQGPKLTGAHLRKLSPDQAAAIIRSTEPTKTLAERYGINPRTVRKIRSGIHSWKWLHKR